MNCRVLLTLTILTTYKDQAAGKLITKPRDTDIKVNQSTYFNCSTDIGSTSIFWFHGEIRVYIGLAILDPYTERFAIDKSERNGTYIYNLVIRSVQPSDAGEYICRDDEGYGDKYSVQLIVVANDPICRSNIELDEVIGQNGCNIEPDQVELECSVTYHGHISPQMEWKKVGENSSLSSGVSVVNSGNHFVSTLRLKGDVALNNSSYVCATHRTTQDPHKCTSQVKQIVYVLSDNFTANKTIGDEIHCKANTSQLCSYKWKYLQDNDATIESSTSVLTARKTGWHRCEAECYLRNQTCNLLVMRALIHGEAAATQSSQSSTTGIYVVISVFVTLVVVGVLIGVFIWITKRRDNLFPEEDEWNIAAKRHRPKDEDNAVGIPLIAISDKETTEPKGMEKNQMQHDREEFTEHRVALNEEFEEREHQSEESESEFVPITGSPVNSEICGLAILDQEVFILVRELPGIEVYDSTKFNLKRHIAVKGMKDPEHVVSCFINNCLYASDWGHHSIPPSILRIDPTNGSLIKTWKIRGSGGRISIASDANVILNRRNEAILNEYTADGDLVREINLSSGTGIIRSLHAVKLNSDLFVVCHRFNNDTQGRVCLISIKESNNTAKRIREVEILATYMYGAEQTGPNEKLIRPMYLSVNKEGLILVSDDINNEAVLLRSDLTELQILVSKEHQMGTPWRTCFDESTGQWLVADHNSVMLCQINGNNRKRYYIDVLIM